jgi:hypothetical protein
MSFLIMEAGQSIDILFWIKPPERYMLSAEILPPGQNWQKMRELFRPTDYLIWFGLEAKIAGKKVD